MTIYLVRHAHAGKRSDWRGDDHERPLSDRGHRQAEALAEALGAAGVTHLYSSPTVRCRQTLGPLSRRLGLPVEDRASLLEGTDPTKALRLLDSHASDTVALCSHGDVLPDLLRLLGLRGVDTGGRRGVEKGGWWTLEHDGERFTNATYTAPRG